MSWFHAAATRLRLLFARRASDDRFDAELRFHIEMETERLTRELGLAPDEARRRALVAFGGVEKHREALRDGRGAAWLSGLSLDFTLGLRMLAKYPGLTFVGVLGMSVAVTVGALAFTAVGALTGAVLPVPDGGRIIAIDNLDARENRDARTSVRDLIVWREALPAVEAFGAYRTVPRNVITDDVRSGARQVAEMTAAGFRLLRVAPLRGRYLNDDDEHAGAPHVAVIGFDFWQQRFGGRDDVIGTTVQLGTVRHTVVGVMPRGFSFPVNNQVWTPLRLTPSASDAQGEAPDINVFGRLAPRASIADAQLQLTTIAQRLAAEDPKRYEYTRPQARPYTRTPIIDMRIDGTRMGSLLHLAQVAVALLLAVIATNVAVLVYARTASRSGEMAVRTALGASRRRVVTQLFAEALVLSGLASVFGIVVAHFVFQRVEAMVRQSAGDLLPYWMRLELTPGVVVYVVALTVLAAVIIGIIPGLKATRRVSENLKDLSGGSSVQLGRTWTALLVAQVAVSVAALPVALSGGKAWVELAMLDRSTPVTTAFVVATPLLDMQTVGEDRKIRRERYTNRVADLARKLEAEPGDIDVVLLSSAPGDESNMYVELDRSSMAASVDPPLSAGYLRVGRVDNEFFAAFGVRVLSGRTFTPADFAPGASAIIVNRSFVDRFLGGGSGLGVRMRGAENERELSKSNLKWEVVGVIEDFPVRKPTDGPSPRVYRPLRLAETFPITLAVRAGALEAPASADRIRAIGISVDPTLRFGPIVTIADRLNDEIKGERMAIFGLVMIALSVVLLSAAGIYALMSFTVTRRYREIGIRMALGAQRGRVLSGILRRALRQIGIGIGIGAIVTPILGRLAGDTGSFGSPVLMLEVAAMMIVVSLLATLGPARRALRVQPTEALRAE
jgi:predicted permease